MNIWIFNHYAVPMEYYPHGRPHWFAKYLAEKGHKVTVFAASTVHNSDKNLIQGKKAYIVHNIGNVQYVYIRTTTYTGNGVKRVWNMVEYMLGLLRNYKNFEKPDCILAMSVHPLACVAGIRLAKKYKCRCVVDIADLWPESFIEYGILKKNSLLLKLLYQGEKWIYKKADAIVFTFEGGKKYIKEKGWARGINPKKIYHINNGVDLEEFEYNKEHFQIQDEDLENEDIFKVVYTGSIRKVYNLEMLVLCAEELSKENPVIKFLIWGDGTEKEKLEKKVKNLHLKNIVFKGKVEKRYIPYILSKADVNLMHWQQTSLSRYGCSLNKLFEYLAAGKLIVSDVKNNYDLLKRYDCGIVIEKQGIAELKQILLKCLLMEEKEKEKYKKNVENCVENYDFKALTNKLEKILEDTEK
ncbi:MAG: glycosyltransferase family 4 protein [Acetivibrio ethanolgignens]